MSITRRAFVGVIRTYLLLALACISLSLACLLQRRAALGVMPVGPEHPGHGELPQLVPDHRFGDEHRDVLAAVVDGDRVPDHVRDDRGATRPRADDPLVAATVHLLDLLHQVVVDERTLLDGPRHGRLAPSLSSTPDDQLVRGLALPAGAALLLSPRARGMAAAGGLALAAAHGVVDRVHGDAARLRALAHPPAAARLAQLHEL